MANANSGKHSQQRLMQQIKADPYLVIEFPVILRLLYSCGLRIGETVKISMNASNMLKKYIEHRRIINDTERHVFSSQTHEKMSVSCIEEIYSKYIEKAKHEYPEMFRYNYTPDPFPSDTFLYTHPESGTSGY